MAENKSTNRASSQGEFVFSQIFKNLRIFFFSFKWQRFLLFGVSSFKFQVTIMAKQRIPQGVCDEKTCWTSNKISLEKYVQYSSHIYQHVRNTGQEFKFEEVKVLDEAIKRRFLEGVHTLMNRDTINRALDISPFFHPMLMGEG